MYLIWWFTNKTILIAFVAIVVPPIPQNSLTWLNILIKQYQHPEPILSQVIQVYVIAEASVLAVVWNTITDRQFKLV